MNKCILSVTTFITFEKTFLTNCLQFQYLSEFTQTYLILTLCFNIELLFLSGKIGLEVPDLEQKDN